MHGNLSKAKEEIRQVLREYKILKKRKECWRYSHLEKFRTERLVVLEQEENCCSICGNPTIETHHIDFSKDNHDPSNLLIVCHWCHSWLHRIHRKYIIGEA